MELVRVYVDESTWMVGLTFSVWLFITVLGVLVAGWYLRRKGWPLGRRYDVVQLDVALGGVGQVRLRPNNEDLQVAHRIWTELVTRKASIPITEDDVIAEIYDSWYTLFGRVRSLIGDVPAKLVREEESTRALIALAAKTLNDGLRPHLTRWHARFRGWYRAQEDALKKKSPQDVQKGFPGYEELFRDLKKVNGELIQYAEELQTLVHGVRER